MMLEELGMEKARLLSSPSDFGDVGDCEDFPKPPPKQPVNALPKGSPPCQSDTLMALRIWQVETRKSVRTAKQDVENLASESSGMYNITERQSC